MDEIRESMAKAAQELRDLAASTADSSLKHRLLRQADQLEEASQEDSQLETISARGEAAAANHLKLVM